MSTEQFEIRRYSEVNDPETVEWLGRNDIKDLFGITYEVTLESHRKWLSLNPSVEILALYFKNQYVGNIVLDFMARHSSVFLQIYIGPKDFRGEGLGTNFMKKALSYLFEEKKQNRIWLLVREYNEVAKKMYSNLGFLSEGIERESVWTGREFVNQERMSLLKRDWKEKV